MKRELVIVIDFGGQYNQLVDSARETFTNKKALAEKSELLMDKKRCPPAYGKP